MSDEFNKSKHRADHDLPQLRANLRRSESYRGGLTAINARSSEDEKYTIGDHSGEVVPKRSLELIVDANGDTVPPEGAKLICRGTAYISGDEQKVAVFRLSTEGD